MRGVRLLPFMKALSIQIQPERAPDLNMEEVHAAFEAVAGLAPLVRHHQFDDGFDETRYFNFTFGTEDPRGLWAAIRSTVYKRHSLACQRVAAVPEPPAGVSLRYQAEGGR